MCSTMRTARPSCITKARVRAVREFEGGGRSYGLPRFQRCSSRSNRHPRHLHFSNAQPHPMCRQTHTSYSPGFAVLPQDRFLLSAHIARRSARRHRALCRMVALPHGGCSYSLLTSTLSDGPTRTTALDPRPKSIRSDGTKASPAPASPAPASTATEAAAQASGAPGTTAQASEHQ